MSEVPVKVLIVEDEAVILHTLELILKQNGFEVRGSRDGSSAVFIWPGFHPDVFLCDINLPDTNGIRLSLQLKNELPNCRVILFSGDTQSAELLEEARKQGHHFEVLAKPTDPRQLLQMLASTERVLHADHSKIHRVK
jgi:CheY-like chemotaxis protein